MSFLRSESARAATWRTTVLAAAVCLLVVPAYAQIGSIDMEINNAADSPDPAEVGDTVVVTVPITAIGGKINNLRLQDILPQQGIDFDNISVSTSQDAEVNLYQDSTTGEVFLWVDMGTLAKDAVATVEIQMVVTGDVPDPHPHLVAGDRAWPAWPVEDEAWGALWDGTAVSGTLQVASPADGCSALQGFTSGNIAIIDRGTCEFGTKAASAQTAGASAVIIVNNKAGEALVLMGAGAQGPNVTIPVFSMSNNEGNALKALAGTTGTFQTTVGDDGWVLYHELLAYNPDATAQSDFVVVGTAVTGGATVEAPDAAFTYSPAAPTFGSPVQFTDTSTGGPTSWAWSFGDGATSTTQSPMHTYAFPGTYTVQLTATNASGSDTSSQQVVVGGAVTPATVDAVIATAARIQGGAFFYSILNMYNAGSDPMTVTVLFTPRSGSQGEVESATFTIPAMTQMTVTDPLGEWFGFGDDDQRVGGLMFVVQSGDPDDFFVQSVILGRNPDDSEYGQFFPAMGADDVLTAGEAAYLPTTVNSDLFRVNVGAMALQDGTVLHVQPQSPIGTELAAMQEFTLDAGEAFQLNDVDDKFNLGGAENYVLWVHVQTGAAVAYVSVLDGIPGGAYTGTNDPTTLLPLEGSTQVVLLALGPVQGFNEFSGSATIVNLSEFDAVVQAEFFLRDDDTSGAVATESITIPAGGVVGYEDVVGDLFGLDNGVGTVVLTSQNDAQIAATAREYAIFRDASNAITGTAGQLIRGLTADDLLMPGVDYYFLGLQEYTTDDGPVRSNLGAFNPGDEAITLTVQVYDGASGALEGVQTFTVPAGEIEFWTSIIDKVNSGHEGDEPKVLVVTVSGEAYVQIFKVNEFGDPITLDPMAGLGL